MDVKSARPPPALPVAAPFPPTFDTPVSSSLKHFWRPALPRWLYPQNTAQGSQLLSFLLRAAITSHVTDTGPISTLDFPDLSPAL